MGKTPGKSARSPVQERAKETVSAILTAATHLFDRDGIDEASTNKIAERAGVGIGSLYQYFRNKDQIVNALAQKIIDHKKDVLLRVLENSKSTTLEERVGALVGALVQAKAENSRMERLLEMQVPKIGIAMKLMEKADRATIDLCLQYLEPHKDELKLKDPEFTLFVIIQSIKGIMIMTNQTRPEYLKSKKLEPMLTRMVLAGLRETQV